VSSSFTTATGVSASAIRTVGTRAAAKGDPAPTRLHVNASRRVAGLQAAYYLLTGTWSILHRRSFERVTGPKHDYWLVRTVGALAVAVGGVLGYAAVTGRRQRESVLLAVASALAFASADVQAARASSRVYLGDVLLHILFVPAWLRSWQARPTSEA
jgi:hypothetical protein